MIMNGIEDQSNGDRRRAFLSSFQDSEELPHELNGSQTQQHDLFTPSSESYTLYESDGQESLSLNLPYSIRKTDISQVSPKLEEFRQWYEVDSLHESPATANAVSSNELPFTRLVRRNMPNYQSDNSLAIKRRSSMRLNRSISMPSHMSVDSQRRCRRFFSPRPGVSTFCPFFFYDWFHFLLQWPTYWIMLVWTTLWTIFVLFFAVVYYGLNHSIIEKRECKLTAGFDFTFATAFGFSLLTTTTVGYTLPGGTNSFFDHCPTVQTAIYGQCIIALLFNTILVSLIYARISRAQNRSRKLIFGNKAIIKPFIVYRGDGSKSYRWTFEFRVFDLDTCHPLVESHVRIYASLPDKQELQLCRLLRPSDMLDGWVFTSVPYSVVHEIDIFSPLAPPHKQVTKYDSWFIGSNGLERRAAEARTLQTIRWLCPICSVPCPDLSSLMNHIKYMKIKNKQTNMIVDSHLPIPDDLLDIDSANLDVVTEDMLRKHLEKVEIICMVEGIEPITSGTFQALQSYTLDEIVFHGSFENCIHRKDDEFVVDLEAFHQVNISPSLGSNEGREI